MGQQMGREVGQRPGLTDPPGLARFGVWAITAGRDVLLGANEFLVRNPIPFEKEREPRPLDPAKVWDILRLQVLQEFEQISFPDSREFLKILAFAQSLKCRIDSAGSPKPVFFRIRVSGLRRAVRNFGRRPATPIILSDSAWKEFPPFSKTTAKKDTPRAE